MTPQEQEMLQGLIQRVNQTRLEEKDSDAEAMLNQTLGRNPDALYILAQTILVQQYALDQAKLQLDQLRQQAQPKRATSFLGGLLGRDQPSATPAPPPPPPAAYAPPQYAPSPAYGYAAPGGAFQQGGFLRGAMQTAAGVAAGALAFEGIESLMHGFGHSGYGYDDRPETINNYYGGGEGREHAALSPDIEDRRGESRFSDAVNNDDHGNAFLNDGDPSNSSDNFADSTFDDSADFSDDFGSGGGDDSGF